MSRQVPTFKKIVAVFACYMVLTLNNLNPLYAANGPGQGPAGRNLG